MKYLSILVLLLGVALLFGVFGCTTSSIYDVDNENFKLINDEAWLYNSEVEASGEELTQSKAWGGLNLNLSGNQIFLMFKVAHIKSPTLDGQTLQATDVAIAGDSNNSYAYVTYMMAGDEFYGCTDILQLKKGYFPKIKSRLITKKEDIQSVTYDSLTNKLFLGLHVNPDIYGLTGDDHGAYLRSVELNANNKIKVSNGNIVTQGVALHSYAANDAAVMDDEVLVPVGAIGGGVERRDTSNITTDNGFISGINDTRAVATYDSDGDGTPDGFLVYQGPSQSQDSNDNYIHGTPKLLKYDSSGNLVSGQYEFDFPTSITMDESKSTIEVHGNVAFVAASDGGVYAIDIDNMTELFNIPNPDPADYNGLTSDKVTANAVTVGKLEGATDKSIIFIANGEYGVRAFELGFDIDGETDVASKIEIEFNITAGNPITLDNNSTNYLGNVHLGDGNSANSVLYRNGYLFVGTGLGGLNVLYVVNINFPQIHGTPHWSKPSF